MVCPEHYIFTVLRCSGKSKQALHQIRHSNRLSSINLAVCLQNVTIIHSSIINSKVIPSVDLNKIAEMICMNVGIEID